jgi:hypothetical protein
MNINNIINKQYYLFNTNNALIQLIIENKILVYTNISKITIDFINNEIELNNELNNNEIELNKIIWKYNENNFRIPYYNNKKILYYKLKDTDNIYDFISLHSFILDKDIISGEKIQSYADVFIGEKSSLLWNPNNHLYSKEMQDLNQLDNINNYKSIFVTTHDLEVFNEKFKNDINDKIIITHNSDGEIKNKYNFKLHLCQNLLKNFNNTIPIPIGIENNQWVDNKIFYDIKNMRINKTKNIYFYFRQHTHFKRKICYEKFINKLEWNILRPKNEYFIEIAKHKYAICPRGNGLDTHRIWECLYLNTIPIVIKDDFINIHNLPIIVLDSWDDLNINNIINEFSNQQISKLTIEYYEKIIVSQQI